MADERAAAATDQENYELLPPEGDPDVGESLFSIVSNIISRKKDLGLPTKWNRNYELKKGKHWRNPNVSRPLGTANFIGTHITRTANNLTANNPTFDITMSGPDDDTTRKGYDDLHKSAQHWWNETEQQDIFRTSVDKGETYGIATVKEAFNPDLAMGQGDVETIVIDPFYFGWWPMDAITNPRDLQKTDGVFFYRPMTVREARRRWPQFAAKFKSDEEYFKDLGEERREVGMQPNQSGGSMLTTILNTVRQLGNSIGIGGSGNKEPMMLVAEGWVHDYTMVSEQEEGEPGEDGEPTVVEVRKPKYPGFIRYVVAANAGKIVMEDRKNPNINFETLTEEQQQMTYLYDKFPFIAVNSVMDDESAWGWSSVEQLEFINMELDKTMSQIALIKDRAARDKIINPKTSGVQNEDFVNDPSILNPVNATEAQGIRRLEMEAPPIDLYKAFDLWKSIFFILSGSFEMDQAQQPGRDVIAYKAIATLLEHAALMMKDKVASYSRLIREQGRMFASLAQNFYTEDRYIVALNSMGQQESRKINGKQMLVPALLTVVSGSTMPISKIQQREEAIVLYDKRAIDRITLLTKMGYDDAAEIDMRMNQGPLADMLNKLQEMGFPQPLLQLLQQVGMMKPNDFERALKDGKVPSAQQILAQINGAERGRGQTEPPVDPVQQAEAAKAQAEIALIQEKQRTEKAQQEKIASGIDLDKEALKLKRAQTVAEMIQNRDAAELEGARAEHEAGLKEKKVAAEIRQGQVDGLKSDNEGE